MQIVEDSMAVHKIFEKIYVLLLNNPLPVTITSYNNFTIYFSYGTFLPMNVPKRFKDTTITLAVFVSYKAEIT